MAELQYKNGISTLIEVEDKTGIASHDFDYIDIKKTISEEVDRQNKSANANAFLMSFTRDMNPGIRFFQSFYDKNGLGVTYSESGDQWASFNQVYVNPAFPTFNSSSEVSIKKNADGSFTLHTKHIFPTVGKEGSAATSGNFDCTISLQKN